jgi:hypothetical protein
MAEGTELLGMTFELRWHGLDSNILEGNRKAQLREIRKQRPAPDLGLRRAGPGAATEIFRIAYKPFDSHGQLGWKSEKINGGTLHTFAYHLGSVRLVVRVSPSGFAGGTNLYAYADNDPVNRMDLTGENPVVFMMLAGAMEGIAGDLFFQMVVQGKRSGCVDGTELAMAGIMGALSGGLGAPAARGAKAINLPAWRKVTVNMAHIAERHIPGGPYTVVGQGSGLDRDVVQQADEHNRDRLPYHAMTETRIIVDPKTIRSGGVGPATGDIWITLGQLAFPMKDWNDFVVVILEAWASALVRLLHGVSKHERLHFMDGPYVVEIVCLSEGVLQLRAIESGRHEKACVDARALPLVESLLAGSEGILSACRDKGCWSTDAERLNAFLPVLQKEAIGLAN